jgi:DNA-binding response OmpR family regulator
MSAPANTISGPPARILVVEDDESLAKFEEVSLRKAGHSVRIAHHGVDALELIPHFRPEVVLLDIDLPDISGIDLCTQISDTSDAFIIFVTGHGEADERLHGLRLGADDYLVKPFRADAVLNRIALLIRRRDKMRHLNIGSDRMIGDGTKLVYSTHTVERNGKSEKLTALEYKLLLFLADSGGNLVTRGQILEHVWNDTSGVVTRVVDVHLVGIRHKLKNIESCVEINGVRSVGYRLDIVTT